MVTGIKSLARVPLQVCGDFIRLGIYHNNILFPQVTVIVKMLQLAPTILAASHTTPLALTSAWSLATFRMEAVQTTKSATMRE